MASPAPCVTGMGCTSGTLHWLVRCSESRYLVHPRQALIPNIQFFSENLPKHQPSPVCQAGLWGTHVADVLPAFKDFLIKRRRHTYHREEFCCGWMREGSAHDQWFFKPSCLMSLQVPGDLSCGHLFFLSLWHPVFLRQCFPHIEDSAWLVT